MEQWTKKNAGRLDFAVRLVPFEDNPAGMKSMFEKLGRDIDLFVSPCDSRTWRQKYAVEPLETVECTVAMSRSHPLAQKDALSWNDLAGQTLMLLQRGESELLDALRDEILREHKDITIIDTEFYDAEVFNRCQRDGCLMESLSLWDGVHPSIVNVKAPWQIRMPYGIVHAKNPPLEVQSFLQVLKE